MTVTLELPDDIAHALASHGDLSRQALESLAVEAYRHEALSQLQVGRLLGLSRIETEDFLARHVDLYTYDREELRRESEALEKYAARPQR
jgi:predicted HTH domain antitoxin